ncbi:FAD-binding oxidoreductase [Geodermatophilus sp. SYSU D00703]
MAPVATAPRRPGTADDAVSGVVPGEVVRPSSVAEVAEVLRDAAAHGRTVVPVGTGTKTSWAAPPTSCDVLLDTTALDRVVEHAPGDLVVVAQAGTRLPLLQARLAESGQFLAVDAPEEGATLGGVVSANASGPRRLRYGTVRDLLIGITVVLADGTVAAAGGKVVKNVAGYDLGKLYTGAHGSLGVVVSTTWRLHPVPPARRVVVRPLAGPREAGDLARRLAASPLTPTAVELGGTAGGAARLVVLFEAIPESVAVQARAAVELLGGGDEHDVPPEGLGRRPGTDADLRLRLAFAPSALTAALDLLPAGTAVTASACTGVAYAALPAAGALDAVARLRQGLAAHDGTAVVLSAPPPLRAEVDHWGPVGDALGLMRRVKDGFDPDRRLSPGRFVGGL